MLIHLCSLLGFSFILRVFMWCYKLLHAVPEAVSQVKLWDFREMISVNKFGTNEVVASAVHVNQYARLWLDDYVRVIVTCLHENFLCLLHCLLIFNVFFLLWLPFFFLYKFSRLANFLLPTIVLFKQPKTVIGFCHWCNPRINLRITGKWYPIIF